MVDIQISVDVPEELFDVDTFRKDIWRILEDEVRAIDKLYAKVYRTWRGKPSPEHTIRMNDRDAYGEVAFSLDGGKGSKKMVWLDEGTRVRHARMSSRFRSKTMVKKLKSRRGKGHVVEVGHHIQKRGIEARGWSQLIVDKRKKQFAKKVTAAMGRL